MNTLLCSDADHEVSRLDIIVSALAKKGIVLLPMTIKHQPRRSPTERDPFGSKATRMELDRVRYSIFGELLNDGGAPERCLALVVV